MISIEDVLRERGQTHGDWRKQAQIAEDLQALLFPPGKQYDASQSQALKMIAGKLSRIVAGDDREPDHFRDIAGYATLAADELVLAQVRGDVTPAAAGKAAAAQDRAVLGALYSPKD